MAPHLMVEDIAVQAIAQATTAFESGGLRDRLARHHADVDGAFWQWNDVWLSAVSAASTSGPTAAASARRCWRSRAWTMNTAAWPSSTNWRWRRRKRMQLRLPDCGHSPQRDQPERTLEAVAAFLQPCPEPSCYRIQ